VNALAKTGACHRSSSTLNARFRHCSKTKNVTRWQTRRLSALAPWESELRASQKRGNDGGLDLDFHGFTASFTAASY
jgi:hypothetical protein